MGEKLSHFFPLFSCKHRQTIVGAKWGERWGLLGPYQWSACHLASRGEAGGLQCVLGLGEKRGEERGEERREERREEERRGEEREERREEEREERRGEKRGVRGKGRGRGRNSSKREREKEVRKDVKGGGRQSQTKRVEIHATVSMHTWTHSMGQNQACYSQGERGRGVGGGWASSPPPSPAHCGPKPVNPAQGTGRVQLDFSPAHKPYQKLHTTSLTHARVELVQYQKPAITVIN